MSHDSNGISFFTNLLIIVSSFRIAYASFEPIKLLGVQAAAELAYPVYLSFTLDPYAVYDALLLKVAEKSVKRPRADGDPPCALLRNVGAYVYAAAVITLQAHQDIKHRLGQGLKLSSCHFHPSIISIFDVRFYYASIIDIVKRVFLLTKINQYIKIKAAI